ncbi:hypothetical protein JXM67_13360 [candidate division WOR-3 bacterium]|nr:hypothetical protein [candidate division WOR-3 bacterium]
MRLLEIFKPKETASPERIVEFAVFSLGSEADLYALSTRLVQSLGTPAWERFAGRRSLEFVLDEGQVADQIPYRLTARLFEDGTGFVRLDLNLLNHKLDLEAGILWRRREFSSALTRFLEAVLGTNDPEKIRHAPGSDEGLRRSGIQPERIGVRLDFGFSKGSILIKIGPPPKDDGILRLSKEVSYKDGVFFLKSADETLLRELDRWCFREEASSWFFKSLRRWLEIIDDSCINKSAIFGFSRFLRKVNRFILRERRFISKRLDTTQLEHYSEFAALASNFDITSRRLSEILLIRKEEATTNTLDALEKLSARKERLFAALVVLVGFAGLLFGALMLIFPAKPWLWTVGACGLVTLPSLAYLLWTRFRSMPKKRREPHDLLQEFEKRESMLTESISQLEGDEGVPERFREELLDRYRSEKVRLEHMTEKIRK